MIKLMFDLFLLPIKIMVKLVKTVFWIVLIGIGFLL